MWKPQNNPESVNHKVDTSKKLQGIEESIHEEVNYEEQMGGQKMKSILLMSAAAENGDDLNDLKISLESFTHKWYLLSELIMWFETVSSTGDFNWNLDMTKVFPDNIPNPARMSVHVKKWSDLAKIIQLYVEVHNKSVQFQDWQKLRDRLDGLIGEDSIKWITQLQSDFRNYSPDTIEPMNDLGMIEAKNNSENQELTDRIKSQFSNVMTTIKQTEWKRQSERKESITIQDNIIQVSSYGENTTIDLEQWDIQVTTDKWVLSYPLSLHFVRSKDTWNILTQGHTWNEIEMQKWIRLANLFNQQLKQNIKTARTLNTDKYRPYNQDIDNPFSWKYGIEINDGYFNDTDILWNEKVEAFLSNANEQSYFGTKEYVCILIDFLNDLYEMQNKPWRPAPSRKSTEI